MEWTGNRGKGTESYRAYGRDHIVRAKGKPDLAGSADPMFHGDVERWNPEELLLTALSQCHMLSYLHVATKHAVVVESYIDDAMGTLQLNDDDSGQFTSVTLRPVVTVSGGDLGVALTIHDVAHELCFIANSVNFPVAHEPRIVGPSK
jgi:organic hydroperoxide reductase OsmC/OhrA